MEIVSVCLGGGGVKGVLGRGRVCVCVFPFKDVNDG
jgi:hypothetical protein